MHLYAFNLSKTRLIFLNLSLVTRRCVVELKNNNNATVYDKWRFDSSFILFYWFYGIYETREKFIRNKLLHPLRKDRKIGVARKNHHTNMDFVCFSFYTTWKKILRLFACSTRAMRALSKWPTTLHLKSFFVKISSFPYFSFYWKAEKTNPKGTRKFVDWRHIIGFPLCKTKHFLTKPKTKV